MKNLDFDGAVRALTGWDGKRVPHRSPRTPEISWFHVGWESRISLSSCRTTWYVGIKETLTHGDYVKPTHRLPIANTRRAGPLRTRWGKDKENDRSRASKAHEL
eukprot:378576-Pelagomonas_calceolata.AAC.3